MFSKYTITVDEEQLKFIKEAITDLYGCRESQMFFRRNTGRNFDDIENDMSVYGSILSEINYSYNKEKEELLKCAIANDDRISKIKECEESHNVVKINGCHPVIECKCNELLQAQDEKIKIIEEELKDCKSDLKFVLCERYR